MKTVKNHWTKLAGVAVAGFALFTLLVHNLAWGDPPALRITQTDSNIVTLTVTNGAANGIYEIYWTEFLDESALTFTNGAWTLLSSGTVGETNFVIDLGDTWTGFFRAVNTNDFDGDGVLNYQDARPFNPSNGLMRVTIESPANGAVVN